MTLLVYPYPGIKPGDSKDVTQLMANFNAIAAVVNGQLDDINFADAAHIDQAKITSGYQPSRLGREGAITGQGLVWDQTNSKWVPQYALPASFNKSGVNQQITSNSSEVAVATVPITANLLGTNKVMNFRMGFGIYNNTGAPLGVTWRFKYGATTLFSQLTNYNASTLSRAGVLHCFLAPANSTTAQRFNGRLHVSQDPQSITAGIGDITQSAPARTIAGSSAENSATSLNFVVTLQMSVNSASAIINRGWYWAAILS